MEEGLNSAAFLPACLDCQALSLGEKEGSKSLAVGETDSASNMCTEGFLGTVSL